MGLWPFGRTKADVETTSRVVVLRARDAVALRAKVTVRFEEPQTQAIADQMLETCQDLVRAVVREAPSGASVLGFDAAIAAEVLSRLPTEPAAVRSVEIAGLHVVGDPGHLAQPVGAPDSGPAWLHAPPTPASSDRPSERTLDGPTPVHGFPLDRPTPVQAHPPAKPASLERGADRPASPQPNASPAAKAPAKPARVANEVSAKPNDPAARGAPRDGAPPDAVRARDPFAATTQSAQPVFKAVPAQAASRAPAPQPADPPVTTSPAAVEPGRSRPAFSHAPTMPAIPVQLPAPGTPIAPRVVLADSPPATSTAPPAAGPGPRFPGERSQNPSPGAYSSIVPNGQPAAAGALRPPASPRRTSSSGQLAAVVPGDGARTTGPPSTGRASRSPDEPAASSRSYAHLAAQSAGSRSAQSPRSSNRPPPAAVAARRRVVASRLLLPMGAGPYEVARGLTPLFRDTAGRILVAFLRTYDLTVIRRVPFDAVESDILSSLTAPSDGAPGTYTASHASEIHRWREAFGDMKLTRLQREANLAAAALAHEMFTVEAVPSSMTAAVVEGLAGSAFGDPDMLLDIGRYLYPARETTSAETLANMIEVAGEEMPPGLEAALDPLFASLREEVGAVAELAKEVMLTPA